MLDLKFIERLATSLAMRIIPQIEASRQAPLKIVPILMGTKEAASYLGFSESAVRHLRHRRVLPCVKIRGRVMYEKAALDSFVERSSRG